MSVSELEPDPKQQRAGRWTRFGVWLDEWIPRFLKVLGLGGIAMSLGLYPFGLFDPVLFGGSLGAASGGFLGDAFKATRQGKE